MSSDPRVLNYLETLRAANTELYARLAQLKKRFYTAPLEYQTALDGRPGRQHHFPLTGSQQFVAATATTSNGRAAPITFEVSASGPWVWTHYPIVMWRSVAPANATDFGRWRPVSTWNMSDQVVDSNIIDISYEIFDSGTSRPYQNLPVPPLISLTDYLWKLPCPTVFKTNSIISFVPTYHAIEFTASVGVPTIQGVLIVTLPGYKIIENEAIRD